MSIPVLRYTDSDFARRGAALRDKLRGGGLMAAGQGGVDVRAAVAEILADIPRRGDKALVEWERKLDGAKLTPATLRVPPDRVAAAAASAGAAFLALVRRVADNIRQYQQSVLAQAPAPLRRGGRELSVRYTPIDRVGVYVPGRQASYPSTVLMTAVPAQVAGVKEIVVCSPPSPKGKVNELVLVLAGVLGITEVYRLGGAQAIGAMAFGTAMIRAVDKIVGPGNAFVVEAKRQVTGLVGIESLPGPSEVLIVADDTAKAEWVAADMIAQAEHNPGSAVLVTPSENLATAVASAIDTQLADPGYARSAEAKACIEAFGAILVVADLAGACEIANEFASEHLQIMTGDDEKVLASIRNAGAIFVGPYTPVPLGDYLAGPSHVLPTGGTARFFGPLSCNDFLKASSVIRYDAAALAADAADVIDFAAREGLTGHAKAIRIRNP